VQFKLNRDHNVNIK